MFRLKQALQGLRNTQPFNAIATTVAKSAFAATGRHSNAVMRILHRQGKIRVRLPGGEGSYVLIGPRGGELTAAQSYWWGWDAEEPETLTVWLYLAKRARTILDVGAYLGHMSLIAAAANPRALVYAFEPWPAAFARLRLHQQVNGFGNLRCFNVGLGAARGTFPFYHFGGDENMNSSNSLSLAFMTREADADGELQMSEVAIETGDGWARENDVRNIDLVKIDTESTEPAVMRGMLETIARDKPDIIVECLPLAHTDAVRAQKFPTRGEIDRLLAPLGYGSIELVSRTRRQERINAHLNVVTGRTDVRTYNVLYSAREKDLRRLLTAADREAALAGS